MSHELARKAFRDQRAALLGWGLGLVAYGLFTVALFPTISAYDDLQNLIDSFPPAVQALFGESAAITTLEGFLSIEFLNYMPVLVGVYGILAGTRAVAGEEDDGTLDLLLAYPLARWKVVTGKMVAMLATMLAICAAVGLALAVSGPLVSQDADPWRLFLAGLNPLPAAAAIGMVAMAASATLPRRRHATLLATLFLVVSFLINSFAELATWLKPTRHASIFYYYGQSRPLSDGIDAVYVAVAAAAVAALAALTVVAFQRRDVRT